MAVNHKFWLEKFYKKVEGFKSTVTGIVVVMYLEWRCVCKKNVCKAAVKNPVEQKLRYQKKKPEKHFCICVLAEAVIVFYGA